MVNIDDVDDYDYLYCVSESEVLIWSIASGAEENGGNEREI